MPRAPPSVPFAPIRTGGPRSGPPEGGNGEGDSGVQGARDRDGGGVREADPRAGIRERKSAGSGRIRLHAEDGAGGTLKALRALSALRAAGIALKALGSLIALGTLKAL